MSAEGKGGRWFRLEPTASTPIDTHVMLVPGGALFHTCSEQVVSEAISMGETCFGYRPSLVFVPTPLPGQFHQFLLRSSPDYEKEYGP